MNQSISLFLLISMLSLLSQSSQSSLQVIKFMNGQKNLGVNNYLFIDETRGRSGTDHQLTIFGWIKISQFNKELNPLMKLSFSDNKDPQYQALENLVLVSYDQQNKSLDLIYQKDEKQGKLYSYKFYMSQDKWMFMSLGLDFQSKKLQLYVSQKNDIFESIVWKILDLNLNIEIPPKFQLSIGCFPVNYKNIQNVQTKCTIGAIKDFAYINDYVDNPTMLFMLDDDYLMINNYVFDNENQKNQVIFPKGQNVNSFLLTGKPQYEKVGSSLIQIFSGKNQLNQKGLILSSDRVSTSSTFTVFMQMSFKNPTEQMTLASLNFSNGQKLKVQIKKDFNIKELGFQFSTEDFMKPNHVANFSFTFVREGQLFWIFFVQQDQKRGSFKIPIGDVLSTEFQILDTQDNEPFTLFKFFRIATTNQSSGAALNYMKSQSKQTKCDLELGTSKKEDRCLSCQHGYVLIPSSSTCERFCPFGFQNILGVCFDCRGDQCKSITKKFFEIKKVAYDTFNVTLLNPIYMRNIKIEDLFYVYLEDEKFGDDYAFNKTLISKNPYVIQYNFIYRDLKRQHLIVFKLRNEKIHSISRNSVPRQITYFNTAALGQEPIREEFSYIDSNQKNPIQYSFLKTKMKRNKNQTNMQNTDTINDQLEQQIRKANDYLLQQKLEKMFESPGIIPMELPKMDKNNYVGNYDTNKNDFMTLQPRLESNKNKVQQPIRIIQKQPYDLNDFKQTQTSLPFLKTDNYIQDNKFYENNQYLPKIDSRQNPIEYKTQENRMYFYPLNNRIDQQKSKEVIDFQPQNVDQQIFYPRQNSLDNVLMRKIKKDKQKQQNDLFFYPVVDRLDGEKQFLQNFPLLEKRQTGYKDQDQNIKNIGLNMLQQQDKREENINDLRKQFDQYEKQKQNLYQKDNDIVEQYRQTQILNNVFKKYDDQIQQQQQTEKLNNVFKQYDNLQQQKKQQNENLERQYQTLTNIFDLHNLQNQTQQTQQNEMNNNNDQSQNQNQTQLQQPYNLPQKNQYQTILNEPYDFTQNIKTAQASQKNTETHHVNQNNNTNEFAYIMAIVTYSLFLLALFFSILKFFLNIYNKQVYSYFTFMKIAQTILIMQFISFQYFVLTDAPSLLQNYLRKIKNLFLDNQIIWKIQTVYNNNKGYNLLKNNDQFEKNNMSNLFLQNYSLMIIIVASLIIVYLILQFISRLQQKQAMDNYIQEGRYQLKSSHYKLALLLEQLKVKIIPLIFLAFALEISIYTLYNLLYVKSWNGKDMFSFLISILFICMFMYFVFNFSWVKRSKSKKLQKKFKRTNSKLKTKNKYTNRAQLMGILFFIIGVINILLKQNLIILLVLQIILFSLTFCGTFVVLKNLYYQLNMMYSFLLIMMSNTLIIIMYYLQSFGKVQYAIIIIMTLFMLDSVVFIIYDFFQNEHRVVEDLEMIEFNDKQDDLEKSNINTNDNNNIKGKKNQDIVHKEEFQTISDQIY